jgi:hypothetical protein
VEEVEVEEDQGVLMTFVINVVIRTRTGTWARTKGCRCTRTGTSGSAPKPTPRSRAGSALPTAPWAVAASSAFLVHTLRLVFVAFVVSNCSTHELCGVLYAVVLVCVCCVCVCGLRLPQARSDRRLQAAIREW